MRGLTRLDSLSKFRTAVQFERIQPYPPHSSLAPPVLALHVLMMYASGGNLDSLLLSRSHSTGFATGLSADDIADAESIDKLPKEERIKAFKRRRQSAKTEWANNRRSFSGGMGASRAENRGVLLLSFEEIVQLFGDIIEGLSFLVSDLLDRYGV